ncbi:CD99 antigen-like protein 2 isoform X2 [Clupea harengus]|uniref:CD99 antigen-like protein 2 n=1 Tax=Clupea harengus TaxID=7950 RepID=A0A6P8GN90_CLUHA|nr:CD99 antigen-like protein 2 isoform X2 [Clupea harengus]
MLIRTADFIAANCFILSRCLGWTRIKVHGSDTSRLTAGPSGDSFLIYLHLSYNFQRGGNFLSDFETMRRFSAWAVFALLSLLAVKVRCEDGFDLADALGTDDDDPTPPPAKPPSGPAGGATGGELDLAEAFDSDTPTIKPPPPPAQTKAPVKPKPKPDETDSDFFGATVRPGLLPRTTPRVTRTTSLPHSAAPGPDDFDLSDALNPNNDIGGKGKGGKGGGQFSDDDLNDLGDYKPDKGKGGPGGAGSNDLDNNEYDGTMAETGTIAGIVSAVAMALLGAVTSYISYQKKKLCFSIQQSLNTDMVKAENPDAVVSTEPQVQQTLLQPPNAEPPTEENVV